MKGEAVSGIPKPVIDFLEGLASAFVIGASGAVLGLNLDQVGWKVVFFSALVGGLNAVISAARRGLTPT